MLLIGQCFWGFMCDVWKFKINICKWSYNDKETTKQDGIIIYVKKLKLNWDLKEKGVVVYVYVRIYICDIWYIMLIKGVISWYIYICKGINKK